LTQLTLVVDSPSAVVAEVVVVVVVEWQVSVVLLFLRRPCTWLVVAVVVLCILAG
jgi:hypothetical protein